MREAACRKPWSPAQLMERSVTPCTGPGLLTVIKCVCIPRADGCCLPSSAWQRLLDVFCGKQDHLSGMIISLAIRLGLAVSALEIEASSLCSPTDE